jgi:hypothetical protein
MHDEAAKSRFQLVSFVTTHFDNLINDLFPFDPAVGALAIKQLKAVINCLDSDTIEIPQVNIITESPEDGINKDLSKIIVALMTEISLTRKCIETTLQQPAGDSKYLNPSSTEFSKKVIGILYRLNAKLGQNEAPKEP